MVRTKRSTSQEHVQEGIARILDFDDVAREQELKTNLEIVKETSTHKTREHSKPLEMCEARCEDRGSNSKEEKHDLDVKHCP